MDKLQLADEIAFRTGMTKTAARLFIDAFIVSIGANIAQGEKITLKGFGSFSVAISKAHSRQLPNGTTVAVPAKAQAQFSPTKTFLDNLRHRHFAFVLSNGASFEPNQQS
jgi:DNA-binding protein HU-beta